MSTTQPVGAQHVRRCRHLLIECRRSQEIDALALCRGEQAWLENVRWIALAAHLAQEVELPGAWVACLQQLSVEAWRAVDEVAQMIGLDACTGLLELGLLIGDHPAHSSLRERDASAREVPWTTLAAVNHAHTRWHDVDAPAWKAQTGLQTTADLVAAHGPPPTESYRRNPQAAAIGLPPAQASALDGWLQQRHTCRNFDPAAGLDTATIATLLHRIVGVLATRELAPGAVALKKPVPSGGGLHATEAYLFAQRVDALAPGIYHYQCCDHALEPVAAMAADTLAQLTRQAVAGQPWFADAAALVVLTTRYERLYWKYRRHQKAWRVALLDAGHISQMAYLAATELGIGVFVTAAVNDGAIEQALRIDPLREGVAAVLGFGRAGSEARFAQFQIG